MRERMKKNMESINRHVTIQVTGVTPQLQKCTDCCNVIHCPFCSPKIFRPATKFRVLKHLEGHKRRAVKHKEYTIFKCNLDCNKFAHFHCAYCQDIFTRRNRFLDHLIICAKKVVEQGGNAILTTISNEDLITIAEKPTKVDISSATAAEARVLVSGAAAGCYSLEGIPVGTDTNVCHSQDATRFIQVSGRTITLLEPPTPGLDADRGEGTSTAAAAADDVDDDEETISMDFRRHEDPDAVHEESQPGNMSSHAIRQLYATHLQRQIQLAEVGMELKRKKMEHLALECDIKRRMRRKLDLEIKMLERELQEDDSSEKK